ncbi:MAG: hypothetical protein MUE50_01080 [Pirellulaceae bacterium]|nr:hypothetical protein [Pirellulaceae bacterium]
MKRPSTTLRLPTVETCPHRRLVARADEPNAATCQLVSALVGSDEATLAGVEERVCTACCESFPPTVDQLNPVVASLVFRAASQVLRVGGLPACDVQRAAALRSRVEAELDLAQPAEARLTPALSMESCRYFVREPAAAAGVQAAAAGHAGRAYLCLHPQHGSTSPDRCRGCRDWCSTQPVSRLLALDELVPPPPRRNGATVRRWAVGVTTSPRRQTTLGWCLDSLVRAGWTEAHLFLDGTTRVPDEYGHWPVTWRARKVGPWPAYYQALTELLLQSPQADAYLILQDDAFLHDRHNLREYLERVLWPGDRPAIVSPYYSGTAAHVGWQRQTGSWIWGAVSFLFPRDVARALADDPGVCQSRWTSGEHRRPIDVILGEWALLRGVEMWFPYPSLVQHVGNTSTIHRDSPNLGPRRAKWFTGSLEVPFAVEESLDDFPEAWFPCAEGTQSEYQRTVAAGLRRMRSSSVAICGLCRDVRHFLPRTAARIERLGRMFGEYQVVLFENDSGDATLEYLKDWARANPRVRILDEPLGIPRFPGTRSPARAAHLARCRNRYREHVLRHCREAEFVIVLDTDLAGGWSYDGIAHTFGCEAWDFVGSYGLLERPDARPGEFPFLQFDTWALRAEPRFRRDSPEDPAQWVLRRGAPLLPVRSCFGGLGVYRMECFRQGEYAGPDCEHVELHEALRRAGLDRLYLNPNQIVLYTP